jgi:PAS domain S-box-containing protein
MDGSPITIAVSGAPLRDEQGAFRGAVCVLRDMTGRLLLEKALREREAMFRGTFEQAAVGMAHTGLDGRWLRVNDRICAITGYTSDEMLSSRFQDITHPDDLEASHALSRDLIAGKCQTYSTEKRYIRKNGQCIWVNLTVALARTPAGTPSYFISVIEDISARKALEQQRSDILSIVAHDLSNPLTVMKTRLQALHRQLAAGKTPDVTAPKAIERTLRRMERLVSDLRDATSAEIHQLALKVEPHDLVALCRMEADAQRQMNKGRIIELDLPEEPLIADIDYDRITRVLGNLLSNAIKYSPPTQPITLSLERQTEPSADGPGKEVARIAVRDRGLGISPTLVPHIFEKFYRVPGVHEQQQMQPSLGLGLYICRTLVEEHHGTIMVETPSGPGSTFIFTLPLTHRKQSRP